MNKINILRIVVENVNLFADNKFDMDFTNQLQVSGYNHDHSYYNLASSIYLPKTIVIKGVNASGKTTILKMIDLVTKMVFNSKKLNEPFIKDTLDVFYFNEPIKITTFYSYNNKVYKTISIINKSKQELTSREEKYLFVDEMIYEKNLTASLTKNALFDNNYTLIENRDSLAGGLLSHLIEDVSLNSMIVNDKDTNFIVSLQDDRSFFNSSKRIIPYLIHELDPTIISFLDPSINKITPNYILNEYDGKASSKNLTYDLHLANGNVIEVSTLQLELMLSSGTLRGLNLLSNIKSVLKTGGYIIIDELELHLNKSIIVDIIRLFKTNETNPKNATLIFSTHYTEILDVFDRNDQIFISHRNKQYEMMLSNYSNYDKKNQLKKSDSYFADTFDLGTAISYDKYFALRKSFKEQHYDWL